MQSNKWFSYDMATAAKAIGEFKGESVERASEWIEAAEVCGQLASWFREWWTTQNRSSMFEGPGKDLGGGTDKIGPEYKLG